jgi:hypothetical protein
MNMISTGVIATTKIITPHRNEKMVRNVAASLNVEDSRTIYSRSSESVSDSPGGGDKLPCARNYTQILRQPAESHSTLIIQII